MITRRKALQLTFWTGVGALIGTIPGFQLSDPPIRLEVAIALPSSKSFHDFDGEMSQWVDLNFAFGLYDELSKSKLLLKRFETRDANKRTVTFHFHFRDRNALEQFQESMLKSSAFNPEIRRGLGYTAVSTIS